MIAALFVASDGPYIGQPGIDPWTKERDARLYTGPFPVIAHPPCERWGRYHGGGPSAKVKRKFGDDEGCFAAALTAVRIWGGVLEHPADSGAWDHFGLKKPFKDGGWSNADLLGGWTCHVEQGHYGHRARKGTWLYAFPRSGDLPILKWGPSRGIRLDEGFHTREERERARCGSHANPETLGERVPEYSNPVSRSARSDRRARDRGLRACEFLSRRQRGATPDRFRDLLIEMVKTFR